MIRQFAVYILLALTLVSCASKPIVDTYNVDMVQYEKDLAQCEEFAKQVAAVKSRRNRLLSAQVSAPLMESWGVTWATQQQPARSPAEPAAC